MEPTSIKTYKIDKNMEKTLMSKAILLVAVCFACQNSPKTEAPTDLAVGEGISQTSEKFISEIESAITDGDSMVNILDENQESLEGEKKWHFYTKS